MSVAARQAAAELSRVLDRMRALALMRLEQAGPTGEVRAATAHRAAQDLADLAAMAGGDRHRTVPGLPTHAVADAVAVTAYDAMQAARDDDAAMGCVGDVLTRLRHTL